MLNLTEAPDDPIERLVWLGGVMDVVRAELDVAFSRAYYEARLTGRFQAALDLRQHSRKRALAYTRAANEARGRGVRWNDGLA